MKTKIVGVRFDDSLLKKMDDRVAALGMSRSEYIIKCVRNEVLTGNPNSMNIVAERPAEYRTSKSRRQK